MAFANIDLQKILTSTNMQRQITSIRRMSELRLKEAIWENVYSQYTPVQYTRTYELLNSVSSSFNITGDTIEIKIYCDANKMHHFSVVDGQSTYIPPLINYGFSWHGMESSEIDYFHNRPESKFLETAINQIQSDMNTALVNAVVTAINSNNYR